MIVPFNEYFKGMIGRNIGYLKTQLRDQAIGGVDIVKDDEILFENALTPLTKRIISGKKFYNPYMKRTDIKRYMP